MSSFRIIFMNIKVCSRFVYAIFFFFVFLTSFSGKAILVIAYIPKAVFGAMFVSTIGKSYMYDI